MSGNKFYAMTIVVEVDPEDDDMKEMIRTTSHEHTMVTTKEALAYRLEWTVQEQFPGVKAVHLAS